MLEDWMDQVPDEEDDDDVRRVREADALLMLLLP
jgi:hypothetical protein